MSWLRDIYVLAVVLLVLVAVLVSLFHLGLRKLIQANIAKNGGYAVYDDWNDSYDICLPTNNFEQYISTVHYFSTCDRLDCTGTRFVDSDFRFIECLKKLHILILDDTLITDGGARFFLSFPQLNYLSVANTTVSDQSISFLCQLNNLVVLNLRGTQVSREGLATIKKFLPHCEINYDGAPPNGETR